MKKCLLFVFFAAAVLHAEPVFEENFETPGQGRFIGFQTDAENPASGKYCGRLATAPNAKSDVCSARGKKFIPVEPGQWYRLSVKSRNDIKNGELRFGLLESRSAEKQVSVNQDWHWKSISLNIMHWHTDVMEFKTASDTRGVRLYIRTESQFSGSSWWDDIRLEKFEKKMPPFEIEPFRAVSTFTDIPTKAAYTLTKGKRGIVTRHNTEYLWEIIDPAKEYIKVRYHGLPKDSFLKLSLIRGSKVISATEHKISGSGTAVFKAGLDKLPEGIYFFRAVLVQNGKSVFHTEKELWRIDSKKIRTPKHEAVRTSTSGKGRQRFVNGKIFNSIYTSHAPTMWMLNEHKKQCKPDLETYVRTMQEQFGQDLFGVRLTWGPVRQMDRKQRKEFVKKEIANTLTHLDFLQKVNCYGSVDMVLALPKGTKVPDPDEVREFVKAIKNHPAFLEWGYDEPEVRHLSPELMKKITDTVRAEDPNHIVNVNLCDPSKFHLYVSCSDVASHDVYPFPGQGLMEIQRRSKTLLKCVSSSAPFDAHLQMFNFNNMEMPTFDQIRSSFLLDRINGSHTLLAYAWGEFRQSFLSNQELQSYYRAIVSMFRRLEPALRNPAKDGIPVISSHEFVASGTFEDGKDQVLIVVNLSNDTPVDVFFVHPSAHASDFFDPEWKYVPVKGKYSFHLAPNGSKVLRIEKN